MITRVPTLFRPSPRRRPPALVLLLSTLLLLAPSPLLRRSYAAAKPFVEESVELPKLTVKGTPVCSFGIGIVCTRNPETKQIRRVFISLVAPDSLAEQSGLHEGDEILALDGHKVEGTDGEIKPGVWFFDQLANRKPGEMLDFEVAVRVVKKVRLRAIQAIEADPAP